jgi:hypothetical protein
MVIEPSSFAESESSLPQAVNVNVLIAIAQAAIRVFFTTVFPPNLGVPAL